MNNKEIKFLLFITILLLSGCNNEFLNPPGKIALEQIKLILITFFLMLIVVIPAIFMSLFFCYKYREDNKKQYEPNWSYSNKLEFVIWTVPIFIIFFLSIIAWKTTHQLEPSRKIESDIHPIEIEVISLDWKWLFIYPQIGIATINQIAFPINTPVHFKITSNTVMNSFFIPSLGSQIYAMSGMYNNLNLISNKYGIFNGFSSNFSGQGFSDMKFEVIVTNNKYDFELWINKIKSSSKKLVTLKDFKKLSNKSINNPAEFFSSVDPKLFNKIIDFHSHNKVIDLP